jgi:hypothetical protein
MLHRICTQLFTYSPASLRQIFELKFLKLSAIFLHHSLCIQGSRACFTDSRVCTQLFCYNPASRGCVAYRPAAEGSACGPDSWCLNAKCVAKLTTRPGTSQLVAQPFYDTLSERASNIQVRVHTYGFRRMRIYY